MTERILTVALVQQTCTASQQENLSLSERGIREAAAQNCDLVILPELHLHTYFCQTENTHHFDLAEPIPGPSCEFFSTLAEELAIVIVTSLFERRAPGLYHNTAVVFDSDGSLAGKYRKMHIPDDPGYYEKFYFTPGDSGFKPVETSIGKLGLLICWDQWFPEAARLMALAGADILIYPTAIGWEPTDTAEEKARQLDAWITLQRGHAIANSLPLISCNRTGLETDPNGHQIDFWGHSFIVGPQGELLKTAQTDQSIVLTQSFDLNQSDQVRRIWPFLRDRRIDAYADLLKRYID